jgi:hypothetical protein
VILLLGLLKKSRRHLELLYGNVASNNGKGRGLMLVFGLFLVAWYSLQSELGFMKESGKALLLSNSINVVNGRKRAFMTASYFSVTILTN